MRGQGLAKLMAGANLEANQVNHVYSEVRTKMCDMDDYDWYHRVIFYLRNLITPPSLIENQKRSLKLQAIKYIIVIEILLWRNMEGFLLKCLDEEHLVKVLNEMHSGECGGHYIDKTTTHKVIRVFFLVVHPFQRCT